MFLEDILRQACKRFAHKEKAKHAKLYNKNGVDLEEDDI